MARFNIGDRAHFFDTSFMPKEYQRRMYRGKVGIVIGTDYFHGVGAVVKIAYADGSILSIQGPSKYAVTEKESKR